MFSKYLLLIILTISLPVQSKSLQLSTLEGMLTASICEKVIRTAYQKMDIAIEISKYPAKRSLKVSNSGMADGELMRILGVEEKYPNLILVNTPICHLVSRVYVKNTHFLLQGWQSLQPYRIAIHRGHLYAEKGTKGMEVTALGGVKQMFNMLIKGRVDLVISQAPDAKTVLLELPNHGIKGLNPPIANFNLYHYLHRKHILLVPKIQEILKAMDMKGEIEKIEQEFMEGLNKSS